MPSANDFRIERLGRCGMDALIQERVHQPAAGRKLKPSLGVADQETRMWTTCPT
jgi:hypothetical protein